MSNTYHGIGRVIAVKYKSAEELKRDNGVLEIVVSVNSASKKKEGEQYQPAIIFRVSMWGKRAEALFDSPNCPVQGDRIYFRGSLSEPTYYEKDKEIKIQLQIPFVDDIQVFKANKEDTKETTAESTSKSKVDSKTTKVSTASTARRKVKEEFEEDTTLSSALNVFDEFDDLDD